MQHCGDHCVSETRCDGAKLPTIAHLQNILHGGLTGQSCCLQTFCIYFVRHRELIVFVFQNPGLRNVNDSFTETSGVELSLGRAIEAQPFSIET